MTTSLTRKIRYVQVDENPFKFISEEVLRDIDDILSIIQDEGGFGEVKLITEHGSVRFIEYTVSRRVAQQS